MSNFAAAEATVNSLRDAGKISEIDEVKAEAVLSMAEALDTDPQNAALWRVYVAALTELTTDKAGESDDIRDIFFYMQSKVGNPKNT